MVVAYSQYEFILFGKLVHFVNNRYQSFTIRYQSVVLAPELTSEHLILIKFEDSMSPAPPSRKVL